MSQSAFRPVAIPPTVQLPSDGTLVKIDSFAAGLLLNDAPEDIDPSAASDMDDMLITRNDRLQGAPGVMQQEVLTNAPTQVILHPGYKYSSALVFLAPPFLGVKTTGATAWQNAGLLAGKYGYTDFAGVLLLSNGIKGIYFKTPDKPDVALIPGAPAALGLTTFANRVVLGATQVAGQMDLMGIGWSDASSDYKGWDEDNGAGNEAMIGSMKRADRFQGFGLLGFDLLAIVNRRSLWTAARTGDTFEPMDIKPKLEDTGCTHASTVLPTEYGVVFLSDDGVRVFDGNSSAIISEPVATLVDQPLESDPYSASIDPRRRLYFLHTPTLTLIYDLRGKRWFKRPRTYLASIWFPVQGALGPTWGTAVGTWGSQTLAWWQLDPQEHDGSMYFVRGNLLGVQDAASSQDFGVPFTPRWFSKKNQTDDQDTLFTTTAIYLTLDPGGVGSVSLWLPDSPSGEYVNAVTVAIPASAKTQRIRVPIIFTGRGVGLGIQIESGSPLIRKASVRFQPTSTV